MKQLLLILLAFGFSFCSKPAETKVIAKGSVKFAIGDVSIVTKEICERINIGGVSGLSWRLRTRASCQSGL